jgi:hypothetical protein
MVVYGSVRHQQNIICHMTLIAMNYYGTEGHMAVGGQGRHQKNIIWTSAMTRSDMNYLLYYTFYLK